LVFSPTSVSELA
jgi:hypothetical protein